MRPGTWWALVVGAVCAVVFPALVGSVIAGVVLALLASILAAAVFTACEWIADDDEQDR